VETLRSLFPTADALLAISPEDLAPLLLRLARARLQPAGFWPDSILNEPGVTGEPDNAYPHYKKTQVEAHVHEAWQSLEREGLIGPSPGMNGRNGWMSLTRAGEEACKSSDAFEWNSHSQKMPYRVHRPNVQNTTKAVTAASPRGGAPDRP
jgi:hypothetical protein